MYYMKKNEKIIHLVYLKDHKSKKELTRTERNLQVLLNNSLSNEERDKMKSTGQFASFITHGGVFHILVYLPTPLPPL